MHKIYSFLLLTIAASLHSMDSANTNLFKKSLPEFFASVIINKGHKPQFTDLVEYKAHNNQLSHNEVCTLILVDKAIHKIMRDTARLRRDRLQEYINEVTQKCQSPITDETWHKYGSAYAEAHQHKNLSFAFNFRYLKDNGIPATTSHHQPYRAYSHMQNDKLYPHFDQIGNTYVHAIDTYFHRWTNDRTMYMTEYYLDTQGGDSSTTYCLINVNDTDTKDMNKLISFTNLLHFPALINAFLQSTETYTFFHSPELDIFFNTKVFCLKGTTIPDNYKESKDSIWEPGFKSFDNEETNPTIIKFKDAIIKKYQKQQQNKNPQQIS